ncbi:MAG: hypothetical protein AAB791_01525, partial [Patescibacteria group bacterium]
IMAILLSTALGFAVFVLSSIRQAIVVDNSVVAYYAADAGLEKSLYLLRKMDVQRIGDKGTPGTLLNFPGLDNSVLGNGASWDLSLSTDYEKNPLRQGLENGQGVKFFFLDRTAGKNTTKSFRVDWKTGRGTPRLQISTTQLDPQTNEEGILVYYTDLSDNTTNQDSTGKVYCYDFRDADVSNDAENAHKSDYVVEVKVIGNGSDSVDSLRVIPYTGEGCADGAEFSEGVTNLTIHSLGQYRKTNQEITASILPRDPVSGLLGFVLFSEADIAKGY